jgi:helix-turn-helix protein
MSLRTNEVHQMEPFVPESIRSQGDGLRPSFAKILELIDQADPAWPVIAASLREVAEAGVELDESAVRIAVSLGRRRWAQQGAASGNDTAVPLAAGSPSIVYYIRRGAKVKIGTTESPSRRFGELLPDEILAFEPGGMREETARHRQFRHLRCHGEYFSPDPELMDHIARQRKVYGDPDPAWPTSASASPQAPPLPRSAAVVDMKEARERFGIPPSTLRNWVRRGFIQRAGREGSRSYLYYVDDLLALRHRCRRVAS